MKLWIKIALLNVIVVVGLGILIGLAVRSVVISSLRAELSKQGESIARNLSGRIADAVLLDDVYRTQEAIDDLNRTEHAVEYVFVTDKNGDLLAHTFKDGHPPDI
jgi:sensor histidine kinase regulating citrate/malate metabolism